MTKRKYRPTYEQQAIKAQSCIDHVMASLDLDPWEKSLCKTVLTRTIPVEPIGIDPKLGVWQNRLRCGNCGQRIRAGGGGCVPKTRDTVCRKCFTLVDWSFLKKYEIR